MGQKMQLEILTFSRQQTSNNQKKLAKINLPNKNNWSREQVNENNTAQPHNQKAMNDIPEKEEEKEFNNQERNFHNSSWN